MKVQLKKVNPANLLHIDVLYALLSERTPEQSISHEAMPTYIAHEKYVAADPHKAWYLLYVAETVVGCVYLSKRNEIGFSVFKCFRRLGYASDAIEQLMQKHAGPYVANINPQNDASQAVVGQLGFKLRQVTYYHE